jgi:hypothetical protein
MRNAWRVALPGLLLLLAMARSGFAAEPGGASSETEGPWKPEVGSLRDPFTFWKEVPKEPGEGGNIRTQQEIIRELQDSAEKSYLVAERAMKDSRHAEAVQACDKGLDSLSNLGPQEEPAIQELHERLYRLRRAADRLQKRAEAEAAFRNLNIKVSGVIAKLHHPMAIVNNHIVGKGGLIETTESEGAIYVDDIQPSRVIVRFRGYRIELPLN